VQRLPDDEQPALDHPGRRPLAALRAEPLSERFEARFASLKIEKSPSVFFAGMEGS
jgi:phosphoribosylformylglycinamidine (FGAM) synthase-like amidotransferase family enzyme